MFYKEFEGDREEHINYLKLSYYITKEVCFLLVDFFAAFTCKLIGRAIMRLSLEREVLARSKRTQCYQRLATVATSL